ncbi:MAG UNVERIFIED_CONTAM: hypothetical protein LVQ98_01445 [Rickettsiaceae bacterium]|jgi:hypothetical protein
MHHSLENLGREERIKQNYMNEFEIDYTKPGAIKHKQDIETIVTSTEKELQRAYKITARKWYKL